LGAYNQIGSAAIKAYWYAAPLLFKASNMRQKMVQYWMPQVKFVLKNLMN